MTGVIETDLERMPVVGDDYIDTRNEKWAINDGAWYGAASDFVERTLGDGKGKWCLIIGSPIPEVRKIHKLGWDTVYIDIRQPPADVGRFIKADATELECGSDFYDAVASTCVVCHAGLGRYGDPIKPNGDLMMLREIYRVLKPGGVASVMIGPATPQMRKSIIYGNAHRIYQPDEAHAMCAEVGFELVESQLSVAPMEPMGAPELEEKLVADETVVVQYCYLSVLLRKPE